MPRKTKPKAPSSGPDSSEGVTEVCEDCEDPCPEKEIKPQDDALVKCIVSMCKDDKAVVQGAATTLVINSRYQKTMDNLVFDGKKWKKNGIFRSGGSARGNEIWINRGNPCEQTKEVVYHEAWHGKQPASMNSRDAEIDAYYNTELWSIKRKADGRPNLRSVVGGKTVPDMAKIESFVDRAYGYTKGKPRIIQRAGDQVRLSDGTWRKAEKGDKTRELIKKELCITKIDPMRLTCP